MRNATAARPDRNETTNPAITMSGCAKSASAFRASSSVFRPAPRITGVASMLPGFGPALERLRTHAETSAAMAAAAGCSPRTVELIRNQDAPLDPEFGELLRLADEAN